MKTVSVNGLVLRTRKYSEADHLLTILTPELGKVSAIAKGARKAKGGMRGKTQPFVFGKYLLFKGQSLYVVTEAEIINSFNHLAENIEKYALASYLCELTDAYLEWDYPELDVFSLLLTSLHYLNVEDEPLLLPWFQLQLLKSLGYAPELESCGPCGKVMGQLLQMDILKLSRLKLAPALAEELQQYLEKMIQLNLNKPLKSTNFLRCIKKD